MKKIILFTICLILLSGCVQKSLEPPAPPIPKEIMCSWEAGNCEMAIGSGYYYDSDAKKCKHFPGGSGCSETPFKTLEECNSVCIKKSETPLEPTSCTDSLDCPKQMKCEDSACIDIGCIEAGKTGPSAGINPEWLDHLPTECCEGLKAIEYSGSFDEDCQFRPLMGGPTAVCTKCGDGQCQEGETNCNCPEDCE